MGFLLEEGYDRRAAAEALVPLLGDYKAKYGGTDTPTAHFYISRWAILRVGRTAFRRVVKARQLMAGARRRPASEAEDGVAGG